MSRSLLNSSETWSGQSFGSLGLTPGTYVWTWGSGANADSFTMNVVPSSVPEPASFMMLGIGAFGTLGYARRRRIYRPGGRSDQASASKPSGELRARRDTVESGHSDDHES